MNNISGYTKIAGLFGNPVKHSLSPTMYNAAFKELGLDCVYLAFEVNAGEAGKVIDAYKTLGFIGGNVTMPFKNEVVPFVDNISVEAQILGAVNTLVIKDGIVYGYNTDGIGLVNSIKAENIPVKDSSITMFGAGGAGVSILVAAALEGAKAINIINLNPMTKALEKIIGHLAKVAPNSTISYTEASNIDAVGSYVKSAEILINATALGMAPNVTTTPLEDISLLSPSQVVVDVVYNDEPTRLLTEAAGVGCKTIDGRGMLIWQGAEAFRLFTGNEMPIEIVKKAIFKGN